MTINEFEQISFSRAICQDCGAKFIFPYNGDMDYGIFYFKGEQGTAFGLYEVFNHPLWAYINKIISEKTTAGIDSTDGNMGVRLQWVVSQCTDNIDNQRLTSEVLCPKCRSAHIKQFFDEFVDRRRIPRVTFHDFEGLSEAEKIHRILTLYAESIMKFPPLYDGRSKWAKLVDHVCELIFRPIGWIATLTKKS